MGRALAIVITGATLALTPAPAVAATITVTTTADQIPESPGCSLRAAIESVDSPGPQPGVPEGDCAVASPVGNTIVVPAGTYEINKFFGALPPIESSVKDLTVVGAGVGQTKVDASAIGDRILEIDPGASVTARDLTLTGGRIGASGGTLIIQAGPPGEDGGAILNQGSLSLLHVAVTNSQAGGGGAALNGPSSPGPSGGDGGSGGGIFNTGALALTGSTITGNRAGFGGVGASGGEDLAAATTLPSGDGGAGGDGGGIANDGGTVSITDSTIVGNYAGDGGLGGRGAKGSSYASNGGDAGAGGAGGSGGGVSTRGGSISITNSTIASNAAGRGGGGGIGGTGTTSGGAGGSGGNAGDGGGLDVVGGAIATLESVTIADNRVANGGAGGDSGGPATAPGPFGTAGATGATGGVFSRDAETSLRDSLVGPNSGGNCALVIDGGHNLTFGAAGCPASFIFGDPQLGPLRDNGGPTATMSLAKGSPAIDRVPAHGAACPRTDQRGVPRPAGAGCDIGAYEVALPLISEIAAHAIATRAVRINFRVTANAGRDTARVEYGRTNHDGRRTRSVEIGGVTPTPVSIVVRGLDLSRTYVYRVIASGPDGTTRTSGIPLAMPILRTLMVTRSRHSRQKTIRYTDTRRALTTLTVQRRNGSKWMSLAAFTHRDIRGSNIVRWNLRAHGHKLRGGVYRLQATPRSGRSTGQTIQARFIIAS
jgi:CSLREA domain-containing protein